MASLTVLDLRGGDGDKKAQGAEGRTASSSGWVNLLLGTLELDSLWALSHPTGRREV